MQLKEEHFYEFGPFRLNPGERLLARADRPVCLSPKEFDLLVLLVENHGRLVTKEQMLATVWAGSFVEESNLTVCVSAVRRSLGDRIGGTRYIETITKSGYRFTAPVRELSRAKEVSPLLEEEKVSGSEEAATTGDSEVAAGAADEELAAAEGESAGVAGEGEIVLTAGEWPGGQPIAPLGQKSWRRSTIWLLLIAVCAVAAIGFYLYVKKPSEPRTPAEPRSLAILPFQNLKHDANENFLGFSLADAVVTKLGYVSSLTVRPSSAVQKYQDQMIDISKVGEELNVDTLLIGNFLRDGDDLRITYQLIDVKSDKILGRDTIDLKYDKLLTVQDNVALQIIKGLALNLSPSEAARIKADERVAPLAYEYYLRGVDLYARNDFPMAIKMLEKSAAIDPNFALTWAYLGTAYTASAAFEFGGSEQYRKAQTAYERALALQPAQLEAQIFLANLLTDTGKVEEAVPLLQEALKTNPNLAEAHWELGYAYRFAGMLKESVAECARARQLDPLVKANSSVFNTYLYLGEYDKFLQSLPDRKDSAFILFYRGFGEYYQKDWERAAKDFNQAFELAPSLYSQIGKAFGDAIAHREADGLERLHQAEDKIQQRGVGDAEASYKIAQGYAVLGDKASALRMLRYSIQNGFFAYPYFMRDPLLDSIRQEAEFPQVMNSARQRHEAFKSKFF